MQDDDNTDDDAPNKQPLAVVDLDTLSETMTTTENLINAAGGLRVLSGQVEAAQEALQAQGGLERFTAHADHISSTIERATGGLSSKSLVNDLSRLGALGITSQVFEDIERQQRLLTGGLALSLARSAMGIDFAHIAKVGESLSFAAAYPDISRMSESLGIGAGLSALDLHRFEIPDLSAIGALSRDLEALMRPAFDIPVVDIRDMLAGIHSPWLDTANTLASAEALVRMQGLGLHLKTDTAFNPDYSALLRESLGDWRDVRSVPDVLYEQSARTAYYIDLGFDPRIVDRPDEAFDESLSLAGIAFAPEDNEIDGRHDDVGLARARQVQQVLQRLEAELRSFIVAALSTEYGPQWYKHLPNNLYDSWIEKQRRDPRGQALEPIDYADFMDFERVICKQDLFRRVFAAYFVTLESARESLMRLVAPRNTAMHSRPIGRDDALFVAFEVRRLRLLVKRQG